MIFLFFSILVIATYKFYQLGDLYERAQSQAALWGTVIFSSIAIMLSSGYAVSEIFKLRNADPFWKSSSFRNLILSFYVVFFLLTITFRFFDWNWYYQCRAGQGYPPYSHENFEHQSCMQYVNPESCMKAFEDWCSPYSNFYDCKKYFRNCHTEIGSATPWFLGAYEKESRVYVALKIFEPLIKIFCILTMMLTLPAAMFLSKSGNGKKVISLLMIGFTFFLIFLVHPFLPNPIHGYKSDLWDYWFENYKSIYNLFP